MTRREKPGLICRKQGSALYPASAYDAEQLDAVPDGTDFDLRRRTRRSVPQHRLYWQALARFNEATDLYPTTAHLHEALKIDLGYMTVARDLSGRPHVVVDSIAFDAMPAEDFREYFDRAMARLAEVGGFDPLEFMDPQSEAA